MKRWRCPACEKGINAPERLARLDVRRWCLVCSAKSPTLVERVLPARETEQARKATARAERAAKKAADAAAREFADRAVAAAMRKAHDRPREQAAVWLRAKIAMVLGLRTWREQGARRDWKPEITIRQGGQLRAFASGHAYGSHRAVVTTGHDAADDLTVLVHEATHLVARYDEIHGAVFWSIHAQAIAELTGRPASAADKHKGFARLVREWLDEQAAVTP